MAADLPATVIFAVFKILHMWDPNQLMFRFHVSRFQDLMIFFNLNAIPENKKKITNRCPDEKCFFFFFFVLFFHNFAYLGSNSANFWILGILMSRHDDFFFFFFFSF